MRDESTASIKQQQQQAYIHQPLATVTHEHPLYTRPNGYAESNISTRRCGPVRLSLCALWQRFC